MGIYAKIIDLDLTFHSVCPRQKDYKFGLFPPSLSFSCLFFFFCTAIGGKSGSLWQNSKAAERTDVLGWLMCLSSSPLKSSASVPLAPSSPELLCRVPAGVRATLQLCWGMMGRWNAKSQSMRRHDNVPSENPALEKLWGQDGSLETGF